MPLKIYRVRHHQDEGLASWKEDFILFHLVFIEGNTIQPLEANNNRRKMALLKKQLEDNNRKAREAHGDHA